ncbi:DUF6913 domain-containing protein [Lutibacter sp.]
MIFRGFKRKSNQFFFKKYVATLVEKPTENSSKKIKNIIVVIDDFSEKEELLKELKVLFSIAESAIKFVIFQQKVSKEPISEDIITPKDFGWYGKVRSNNLKAILTKKYDLLINYSKVDNLYTNVLLLQCKTSFKAGFAHLDNRLYNLIINCESSDLKLFNSELKKYLTILNKIE